jgi:acyl-CoA thioester hydrolase
MVNALDTYPVIVEEIVRWGDLDALGHVNNTLFFRYFETARIAYFEKIGLSFEFGQGGIGPILGSTQCRFRRPLRYPDRLKVGAGVVSLEKDRFTMEYAVWSETQAVVAANGEAVIVAYDYGQNRKAAVAESVRAAIVTLQPELNATS